MRKVMLLAAMLAMVLAAAVPAFAQPDTVVGDENVVTTEGDETQYNAVCQNIIGSFGDITQTQSGQADAVATDDSVAIAEVAQEQDVSIAQVNQCLNDFDEDGDGFVTVDEKKVVVAATASPTASPAASPTASPAASPAASPTASPAASPSASPAGGELPETGGASVIALGAGALLVAGGLLARRIVR